MLLPSLQGTLFMEDLTLKPVAAGSRAADFSTGALLSTIYPIGELFLTAVCVSDLTVKINPHM